MGDVWGRELDFRPFGGEVGDSLRLNSGARDIPDVVAHELECPFGDSSCGIIVADDVSQWVQSDNNDLVISEVIPELTGRHQNGV